MKATVAVLVACLLWTILACAQPLDVDPDQGLSFPLSNAWSVGLTLSSLVSGLEGRVWISDQFGVEASVASVVVPLQVGIRGLYRPLRSELASLYIGPGVGWREGGFLPHVFVGTEWLVYGPITISLCGGVGYIGSGTWLPPGPIPTLSSRLYSFFSVSLHCRLDLGERAREPGTPLPSM